MHELELNEKLIIFASHKTFLFLGYILKNSHITENTLQGKLLAYRIKNCLTYSWLGKEFGLDKSTLIKFEKGKQVKVETVYEIDKYLKTNKI